MSNGAYNNVSSEVITQTLNFEGFTSLSSLIGAINEWCNENNQLLGGISHSTYRGQSTNDLVYNAIVWYSIRKV